MKTWVLPILLLLYSFNLSAQDLPLVYAEKIPIAELHEDLATLKENLELVHAGLYMYNTKATVNQTFKTIKNSIKSPITAVEFYRKLLPLLPVIANGHTNIIRPKAMAVAAKELIKMLPLETYWDRDTLFVAKNLSNDESIQPRTAILTINEESTKVLFEQMTALMTRDGINKTLPVATINHSFAGWYINIFDNPENYDLQLMEPDGIIKNLRLKASTLKERNAIKLKRYGPDKPSFWKNDESALQLKIDAKIATLTIKTFANAFVKKEKKQRFKKFYKDAFKKIEEARVEHLIIDLRNNGGGDPNPTLWLLAHLLDKPFTFYKAITAVCEEIPNRHLYGDGIKKENLLNKLVMKKRGDIYEVKESLLTKIGGLNGLQETKPANVVYKNKLYILTNPHSFSATGEITAIIKEHNLATFIGEEPGGNPNRNVSGTQLRMTLPNSKVRVAIPLWLWEMDITFDTQGRGIIPDHMVRNTIEDELSGRDAIMEYTLDLIRQFE